MILRKLYIYLVLIAILAISPLTVFSAGNPDVNTLKQEIVVKNAITEGDALYVVHYDIDYTVLPTEPMHQLYSGILISQDTSSGVTALEGQSFPFYEEQIVRSNILIGLVFYDVNLIFLMVYSIDCRR